MTVSLGAGCGQTEVFGAEPFSSSSALSDHRTNTSTSVNVAGIQKIMGAYAQPIAHDLMHDTLPAYIATHPVRQDPESVDCRYVSKSVGEWQSANPSGPKFLSGWTQAYCGKAIASTAWDACRAQQNAHPQRVPDPWGASTHGLPGNA